jgi:hypothetical protein
MVRVYANLTGLAKELYQAGSAEDMAHSLTSFASSFTHSRDLFDLVDVGERKGATNIKIRGIKIL